MLKTLKPLIDKVNNPRLFDRFMLPGRFDAAEYLYNFHWEKLDAKTARNVEAVLSQSGKYKNKI